MQNGSQEYQSSALARMIGSYEGEKGGKQVLVIAGVHGNEQAGVRALQTVLEQLEKISPPFKGSVVGIMGNCAAIEQGVRYIEKDLNRNWTPEIVTALQEAERHALKINEDRESKELLDVLDFYLSGNRASNTVFIDLHGTSADGGGFSIINNGEDNQALAEMLKLPVIYGLESKLWGTLQNHLNRLGLPGVLFEGGQIDTAHCEAVHVAGLWTFLVGNGCVAPEDVPDFKRHQHILSQASADLPNAVRIAYRHAISDSENFRFLDGFKNFQPVWKGMHLAMNENGAVNAPQDGLLLMPLYQAQGEDGFFLVEEIG